MKNIINELIQKAVIILNKSKGHGDYFNLLKISGMASSEVLVHTPILKELLNPAGLHGQNDFFLRSFFEYFEIDFEINKSLIVKKEQRFKNYGQIDIIISNDKQIIVIENKIYAEDQPKQLNRYYDYCMEVKKNPLLIYLTLDGKKPSKYSLGTIKCEKDNYYMSDGVDVKKHVNIKCFSYQKDIVGWLDSVLEFITAPNLIAAISQYINLLKILTGEITIVNAELRNLMVDFTMVELEAIQRISTQFNSSEFRGDLLFNLFRYVEREFLGTSDFELSSSFPNINYTLDNCRDWFKQISKNNTSEKRNVIGVVLKSKTNPLIHFLFIAATDYIHYGLIIDEDCTLKYEDVIHEFPSWMERENWNKFPKTWVSQSIADLRGFKGDAFRLLTTNENSFLDDFINDRLSELNLLIKK